jgi:hypothetical protein
MVTIDREISEPLHRLPIFEQRRVLEFARQLAKLKSKGVPGKDRKRPGRLWTVGTSG